MDFLNSEGLSYFYEKIKQKFIRSINSKLPDNNGNITITNVATADNLTSPDAQTSYDSFIYRTSGGTASLASGEAQLIYIDGNIDVRNRVLENFNINSTNNLIINYDAEVWNTMIQNTGEYIFSYTKPTSSVATNSWKPTAGTWRYNNSIISLNDYGLNAINIIYPSLEINSISNNISNLKVIPNTWMNNFQNSDNYEFIYSSTQNGWILQQELVNLSNYGITFSGTPENEDKIIVNYQQGTLDGTVTINYTAPQQGTIVVATPTAFKATGFNQFDNSSMYIQNATISNGKIVNSNGTYVCYCRAKGGVNNGYVAYSENAYIRNIGWCANLPAINETVITTNQSVSNTLASIPFEQDGYVVVVVTNVTDLCIHPKWSGSADTDYKDYVEPSIINLPTVDINGTTLPIGSYGMPALGSVADRLNLDAGVYIQKIGRVVNNNTNMNYVIGLDTEYDYDANYIYYVLLNPVTYNVIIDPVYTVNDFGTEEFLNTDVSLYAQILYGQNLRDKLRTDVLTISSQELTNSQKMQIYNNLGLSGIHYNITINNFPYVVTDTRITANHRVVNYILNQPQNISSDITWTTSNGQVEFDGQLKANSTITIDFDLIPTIT